MYLLEITVDWTAVSAIGSMIAAIIAAVYTVITYKLLQKTNQTSQRTNTLNEFEIYREISDTLNKETSRKVLNLCLENNLEIKYSDDIKTKENCITGSDINQMVLNPLEDLAMFWKKGLITIGTINEGIGYKILKLGNCQAIVDHISKVRDKMPNVFSGFEQLYKAVFNDSAPEEQEGHRSELFPKEETKLIKKSMIPAEAS